MSLTSDETTAVPDALSTQVTLTTALATTDSITDVKFSPDGRFAFTCYISGGNLMMASYTINAQQGTFTVCSTVAVELGCGSSFQSELAVHPTGNWVFISSNSQIYTVAVANDGTLTVPTQGSWLSPGSSTLPAMIGNVAQMSVTETGSFLTAITMNDNLHIYSIDPVTGLLSEMNGSPWGLPANTTGYSWINDKYLVTVNNSPLLTGPKGSIHCYTITSNTSGGNVIWALAPNPVTLDTATTKPCGVTYSNGTVIVIEDEPMTYPSELPGVSAVTKYTLGASGTLTFVNSIAPPFYPQTVGFASSAGVFVAGCLWDDMDGYMVNIGAYDNSGSKLSYTGLINNSVISMAWSVIANPSENFVYVLAGNNTIYCFAIASPSLSCTAQVTSAGNTLTANFATGYTLPAGATMGFKAVPMQAQPATPVNISGSTGSKANTFSAGWNAMAWNTEYVITPYILTSGNVRYEGNSCTVINTLPQITSIPNKAVAIGGSLTIQVQMLPADATKSISVQFAGGATATGTLVGAAVTVTVPAGAQNGPLNLIAGGVTGLPSASSFKEQLKPIITGYPSSGAVGSSIVITGNYFDSTPSNNQVAFYPNIQGTITAATAIALTVTVPAGITPGVISVTTNGLTTKGIKSFSIQNKPVISSVTPAYFVAGMNVIVKGSNFSMYDENIISFGGMPVRATPIDEETIYAPAPNDLQNISVSVIVNGVSSDSFGSFPSLQIQQYQVSALGNIISACFAGGSFYVLDVNGKVASTVIGAGGAVNWQNYATYNNARELVGGSDPYIITGTSYYKGQSQNLNALNPQGLYLWYYGNGTYLATGPDDQTVYMGTSPGNMAPVLSGANARAYASNGNNMVGVNQRSYFAYGTGKNWNKTAIQNDFHPCYGVTYFNNSFYAIGAGYTPYQQQSKYYPYNTPYVYSGSTGSTWAVARVKLPEPLNMAIPYGTVFDNIIAASNKYMIAVAAGNIILTTDGTNWATILQQTGNSISQFLELATDGINVLITVKDSNTVYVISPSAQQV
ncbi:MAG: hypothetical protein EOP51_00115 [Sphingobacteriales bacterium]|nr:MAG: hypothetical protein EOP51_00115 [Sphingobacteriales bacterium]